MTARSTVISRGRAIAADLEDSDGPSRAERLAASHFQQVLKENDALKAEVAELRAALAVAEKTAEIAQTLAGRLALKVQDLECQLASVNVAALILDVPAAEVYAIAKGR